MKTREEVIEMWRAELGDFVDKIVGSQEVIDSVASYIKGGASESEALQHAIEDSVLVGL